MINSLGSFGSSSTIESLVSQYMELERKPLIEIEARRDQLDIRSAVFTDLRSKINALKRAAEELAGIDKYSITKVTTVFDYHTVKSSDEKVATATASSSAANGIYTLENIVLAKSQTIQSSELPRSWKADSDGTIVINGTQIAVSAGATLEDVRKAINNADFATDRGVVATIVNVSDTHSRLILTAKHTGTEYAIKATDLTGSILSSLGLTASTSNPVAISAIATSSEDVSYPAANLIDGATGDAGSWHGADTETSWTVTLDLGSVQTVNRLVWGRDQGGTTTSGTPKNYTIQYLDDDGETWHTIKTVTDCALEAGGTQTDTFYSVNTSKLRITITATNDGAPPAMDEISLHNDEGTLSQPVLQEARDASFTINGVAVSGKQSNTITDTISGLTINLLSSSGDDPLTLTVESDTKSMQEKIEQFLSKLNELIDYIKEKSNITKGFDGDNYTRGALAGNYLYTGLAANLSSDLLSMVTGAANGALSRLSDLGITMDENLHFVVSDSSALTGWLNKNPKAVAEFFGANDGIGTKIVNRLDPYVATSTPSRPSYIDAEIEAISNERGTLNERITTLEERLRVKEQSYRSQFTRLLAAIIEAQSMQQRIQSMLGYGSLY